MAKKTEVRRKYEQDVNKRMAALHGQSRKGLERDDVRGAKSPLGDGEIAERERRKRR